MEQRNKIKSNLNFSNLIFIFIKEKIFFSEKTKNYIILSNVYSFSDLMESN
jgi:hypothetical protein